MRMLLLKKEVTPEASGAAERELSRAQQARRWIQGVKKLPRQKLNTKEGCSYAKSEVIILRMSPSYSMLPRTLYFRELNIHRKKSSEADAFGCNKQQEERNTDVAFFQGDLSQGKPSISGSVRSYTNTKFRLKWRFLVSLTTQLCHVIFFWKLSCERSCDALMKAETWEGAWFLEKNINRTP